MKTGPKNNIGWEIVTYIFITLAVHSIVPAEVISIGVDDATDIAPTVDA